MKKYLILVTVTAIALTMALAPGVKGLALLGDSAGADLPGWDGPTESIDVTVSNEEDLQEEVSDGETGEVIGVDSTITLSSFLKVRDVNDEIVSATRTRQIIDTGEYAIDVWGDGVCIKGLEIVGEDDDDYGTNDKGIRLKGSRSDVSIKNNIIRGCWEPIIFNSTNTSHKNITVANNDLTGEWIGVMAFTVEDSTIRNNYMHDIGTGIQMSIWTGENNATPQNNVIKGNTFEDLDPGVGWYYGLLLQGKDTEVIGNEFKGGGQFGVLVTDSITAYGTGDRDISGNEIHFNNFYEHSRAGVAETEDYYADLSPSGYTVDATRNWWGEEYGAPGKGQDSEPEDEVSGNVEYHPWLSHPVGQEGNSGHGKGK